MHCRWPSFHNIHKELAQSRFDLKERVIALEKLDGSNLGLEVSPTNGLIALHGRNGLLWSCENQSEDPFSRRYGSVRGTLEPLSEYIDILMNLSDKFLKDLSTNAEFYKLSRIPDSIIFYGEWYNGKDTEATPSWHPFGHAFRGETMNFRTMTSELHGTFIEHGLCPPKKMFSGGTLCEAVEALGQIMKEGESFFEGVFITSEKGGTRNCCKWKTGFYEEQSNFILASESTGSEEMSKMVDILRDVFETKHEKARCSKPRPKKTGKKSDTKKEGKNKDLTYDHMITLAMNSVLSKSSVAIEDIRFMEHSQKIEEAKRINKETLEDLIDSMVNAGEEMSEEKLKETRKRVGKIVSNYVMRG